MLVPSYKAGVFWVGLASLRDASLVSATISQTIGSNNGLAEHIAEREMLLLLDNLEHVIEAAPELSSLLPALSQPDSARHEPRAPARAGRGRVRGPSARLARGRPLFCERSRLEPSAEIAELCARLDDLPLALELAAARTKALSPQQILERLAERLTSCKAAATPIPDSRHCARRSSGATTYSRPRNSGSFARSPSSPAAARSRPLEAVAEADLDTLQSLIERSLLRFSNERYWMLETIREYATHRVKEVGEAEELSDRHADYFLDLAQRQGPLLESALQSDARHQLMRDESNLRLALMHAYHRSPERLLEFVSALALYWTSAGQSTETQIWAQRALANAPPEATVLRADALLVLSLTASRVHDTEKAVASAQEAIGIYRVQHSHDLGAHLYTSRART